MISFFTMKKSSFGAFMSIWGFAALYLILFCYCTLRAKLGMRKEEWQELQRRLKVRQQQSDYSAAAAGAWPWGLPAA